MAKTGRNDSCPCGSGRKYKKCCLEKDRAETGQSAGTGDGVVRAPSSVAAGRGIRWPRSMRKESRTRLEELQKLAEYEIKRAEIDAAHDVLEAYQDDYDRLLRNRRELLERAEALFSEPPFDAMRFTVAELDRAFATVGYPAAGDASKEFAEIAERTIRFLIGDDRRIALARELACLIVDYVHEERYLDACIIEHNFIQVAELEEGPCGLFLTCMFMEAMRKWEAERDGERVELLANLGLAPESLSELDFDSLSSHLQNLGQGDGDMPAVEQFLEEHPQLRAQVEAEIYGSQDAAVALLQRDEGRFLLLPLDEIQPWFGTFSEQIVAQGSFLESARRGKAPSKKLSTAFFDLMYDLSAKMADEIFTRERLQRLTSDVCAYQASAAPKDQATVAGLKGAVLASQMSIAPSENHFLTSLCLQSVLGFDYEHLLQMEE